MSEPGSEGVLSESPFVPNMATAGADFSGSSFAAVTAGHSVVTGSSFFNSFFHKTNLESCTFQACELDGSLFDGCSLRAVELRDCDVEGLVINGIRVGELLKLLVAGGE
jgi:uncharacterized protein YjbI with pentapeptide repeats